MTAQYDRPFRLPPSGPRRWRHLVLCCRHSLSLFQSGVFASLGKRRVKKSQKASPSARLVGKKSLPVIIRRGKRKRERRGKERKGKLSLTSGLEFVLASGQKKAVSTYSFVGHYMDAIFSRVSSTAGKQLSHPSSHIARFSLMRILFSLSSYNCASL